MHIILGALGVIATIVGIFYRLAQMGIDLGGLNPFLWRRRRRWKKKYETNAIYTIEKPLEAAALALTATAKVTGEISSEEKKRCSKCLRMNSMSQSVTPPRFFRPAVF